MEQKPEDFLSRDADGFMDKITDLMDDEEIGAPGSQKRLLVPVKYVGANDEKRDNVAATGKVWKQGETLLVENEAAEKLLRFPDVWAFDPDMVPSYSVAPDGSGVLEYPASADEVRAIMDGKAELRVVYFEEQQVPEHPEDPVESVMAMSKRELVAYAAEHFGLSLDSRRALASLQNAVVEAIHATAAPVVEHTSAETHPEDQPAVEVPAAVPATDVPAPEVPA